MILGISKLRRKKNLLTVHNVLPHENTVYRRFVHTAVYHFADEFIVHTEENRNRLMTMVNNKKVHIVHHGVSQPRQVSMTRPEARQLLGIGRDDKILLCFGHIRAYKGLDVAIDALANTEDKSIKLLVVGKCWGEWDKYQQKINARRLEGRIIVKPGYVPTDQIEAYFRAVDLVLLPYTHFDAQSGVGAMAVGFQTPLIVSDAGGLKEYVGSRDFVFKSGDSEELAGKIGSALSNPFLERDCAAHMQALGEDLGWQSAADKTVAIYRSMLGQL
ncbi:MAG: glycosyltransferase family 4 protein [Halieaceae bacterium]|nr:glycosyltransferase family 4 protein [Halieaceae bacterium]